MDRKCTWKRGGLAQEPPLKGACSNLNFCTELFVYIYIYGSKKKDEYKQAVCVVLAGRTSINFG
jgi:hypothetical protein